MSGFRTAQVIVRQAPGAYINGVWIKGEELPVVIQASVQPLSNGDLKLIAMPEGRRMSDILRLYTSEELVTVEDKGEDQQADKLIWRGNAYELSSKFPWQSGVIPHFKYFATKVPVSANI